MEFAHENLPGLDRDRIVAAVVPVLRAHRVEGVELVWRTDRGARVLELTLERAGSRIPGEGITLDLCSEVSRDLSAALDVADAIPGSYRLQVGSPGLDRALYGAADYARFAGQSARLKLRDSLDGSRVYRGTLHGLDEDGRVLLETESGEVGIDVAAIHSARLVFDWKTSGAERAGGAAGSSRRAARRRRSARRSQGNR
jgi:ribosome maturation factor RimP